MKFGVVVFPGSNCDHDCYHVLKNVLQKDTDFVWHKDRDIAKYDCIVLPGGFSYGDYLRTGAIARFSPVMESVYKHADRGKLVIGICNGFQILLEAGLLPGAMLRNRSLKFICKFVELQVQTSNTPFTKKAKKGEDIQPLLYQLAECLRHIGLSLLPIIPSSAEKILKNLNIELSSLKSLAVEKKWSRLKKGVIVNKGEALFPRL